MMYADDWSGGTPYAYQLDGGMYDWSATQKSNNWKGRIFKYTKSAGIFRCPNKTKAPQMDRVRDLNVHYGINTWLFWNYWDAPGVPKSLHHGWWMLNQVPSPSRTIMVCENRDGDFAGEPWDNTTGGYDTGGEGAFYPYHGDEDHKGGVFIFNDGHAKWMSVSQTQEAKNGYLFYWWRMKDGLDRLPQDPK